MNICGTYFDLGQYSQLFIHSFSIEALAMALRLGNIYSLLSRSSQTMEEMNMETEWPVECDPGNDSGDHKDQSGDKGRNRPFNGFNEGPARWDSKRKRSVREVNEGMIYKNVAELGKTHSGW